MPFCPQCGKQLDSTMNFCPGCGLKVGDAVQTLIAEEEQYINNVAYTADEAVRLGRDYSVILVSEGTAARYIVRELLTDIMDYSDNETYRIICNLPAEIATGLTEKQARIIAQALAEYGAEIAVANSSGYVDIDNAAVSSVYRKDGQFLSSTMDVLATLTLANRVTRFMVWDLTERARRYLFRPRYIYQRPIHIRRPLRIIRPAPAPKRPAAPKPAPPRPKVTYTPAPGRSRSQPGPAPRSGSTPKPSAPSGGAPKPSAPSRSSHAPKPGPSGNNNAPKSGPSSRSGGKALKTGGGPKGTGFGRGR